MKLQWKPDWELGVQEIDQQHQNLFAFLRDVLRYADDQPLQQKIFTDFGLYARIHSAYERDLLLIKGHQSEAGEAQQDSLVRRMARLRRRLHMGKNSRKYLSRLFHAWMDRHLRNERNQHRQLQAL